MNIPLISFAIIFTAVISNRFILTNAINKLDDRTKLKFLDVFPRRNNYSTIILVAVIMLYFGAVQAYPQYNFAITVTYLGVYIIYFAVKSILDYGKLKEIGTPADYIKSYILAGGIFLLGILAVCTIYIGEFQGWWRQGI